jgi:hypothetical protein
MEKEPEHDGDHAAIAQAKEPEVKVAAAPCIKKRCGAAELGQEPGSDEATCRDPHQFSGREPRFCHGGGGDRRG